MARLVQRPDVRERQPLSKANRPEYRFQACTQAEVDEAYATAKAAHKTWARTRFTSAPRFSTRRRA